MERTLNILSEQQNSGELFSTLSLNDIYGYYPVDPRVEIKTDHPYPYGRDLSEEEKRELCRKNGIPTIGAYGGGREMVIRAGRTEKLTWWAPHEQERQLLIRLAQSIAPDKDKPFILDIGCGSGFVCRLLADAGNVRVVGIDKNRPQIEKIPETQSQDVKLMEADAWDIPRSFGPTYQEPILSAVNLRLSHIRAAQNYDRGLLDRREGEDQKEEWRKYHRAWYLAKRGVKELQKLTSQIFKESPVDVVLSSFMDQWIDLTVPIRDAIYPRMIIYVKAVRGEGGRVGSGMPPDYNKSCIGENKIISFDVGKNFTTIAHWRTLNAVDWAGHIYPSDDLFSPHMDLTFEVVIQLRNDVQLTDVAEPRITHYPWDDEIVEVLKVHGKDSLFFGELSEASKTLTQQ